MKAIILSLVILVSATFAHADAMYIACGTGLDKKHETFTQPAFMLYSDDSELDGSGRKFLLFNAKNEQYKNAKTYTEENGNLRITVVLAKAVPSPVGFAVEIQAPKKKFIKAVKKAMGGVAGGSVTGKYDCVVGGD